MEFAIWYNIADSWRVRVVATRPEGWPDGTVPAPRRDQVELRCITEFLADLPKQYWFSSPEIGHNGRAWRFLVGSNWPNFDRWRKLMSLDGEAGREIRLTMDMTRSERRARIQQDLFDGGGEA
jgi:hypothetical protein